VSAVTHTVLVEWDGDDRSVEASRLSREHLPRIEGVESVQAGPSVSTEGKEGGFEWMLVVRFRDQDALAGYVPHPEHRPVAEYIGASSARVVVFDVEDAE